MEVCGNKTNKAQSAMPVFAGLKDTAERGDSRRASGNGRRTPASASACGSGANERTPTPWWNGRGPLRFLADHQTDAATPQAEWAALGFPNAYRWTLACAACRAGDFD